MSESPGLDGTLHLVVAWASGRTYVARQVKMSDAVADALRSYAMQAVDDLADPTPYAPDARTPDMGGSTR